MNIDEARAYFLSKQGAEQGAPFGDDVPVFKVGGKMFSLIGMRDGRPSLNLKYPPDSIEMLRSGHTDIVPGYHMNKQHWNTVYLDGSLEDKMICELIDISYDLVFKSLTKKIQQEVLSK